MAAIDGIEVLLHQGAAAFELFTKEKVPLDVMRRAIESRSGGEKA
jgi:shikimate 5-dehydrogenase